MDEWDYKIHSLKFRLTGKRPWGWAGFWWEDQIKKEDERGELNDWNSWKKNGGMAETVGSFCPGFNPLARKHEITLMCKIQTMNYFNMYDNLGVHYCGASGSMCICHTASLGSIPGRDKFPGRSFSWVFPHLQDKYQEALGPPGRWISFRHHNHPSHIYLVRMNSC